MFKKLLSAASKHKIITGIIMVVILTAAYYGYNLFKGSSAQTSYVLAAVQKGTLITSVSGSGQVSALNQVDIKSKASGDIIYLDVNAGQEVKAGALLAQIDSQDALKAIRDAKANLDSAKLSLQKLEQPADQLSVLQAQNSLVQAQESKQKSQDDLQKAYDDGFNTVSNAFLDMPSVMAGLNSILIGSDFNKDKWNIDYYADAVKIFDDQFIYRNDAYDAYNNARAAYDKNFSDYKSANRYSSTDTIESLINETYDTTKKIAEAVKSIINLIQFYEDKMTANNLKPATLADTHLSSLNSYTGKTNSNLSSLLSIKQSIENDKKAIIDADRSIAEKEISIAKLEAGADPLDVQSQQMTIGDRQNALLDAQQKLADYYIRAPFNGVIAEVPVKKGDAASASTIIATLITKQQIAEVSLNEVDAAKVKTGQKATLTFDAIDGLEISGQVDDIDTLGTISQGVVAYSAKIGFDTQDDRVKPGMSVSANIITQAKQDILYVPNSAIKTSNSSQYVQTLDQPQTSQSASISQAVTSLLAPRQVPVQTGISNDTFTEITSGLKEGDQIISRTVSSSATQTTTQQNSLFGGSSGAIRAIGR